MILIVSRKFGDFSTEEVMDWLEFYGVKPKRINGIDLMKLKLSYNLQENSFQMEGLSTSEITKVWFRKWIHPGELNREIENYVLEDVDGIEEFLKSEYKGLKNFFYEALENKAWLNRPSYFFAREISKPMQLKMAKKVGLNVPKTLISNEKDKIQVFVDSCNNVIVKNVQDIAIFKIEKRAYVTYTQHIDLEEVNSMAESFFPVFIQERIRKEFEIRVFHLCGRNYAMAIFSQMDEGTKIDFRLYHTSKFQRWVPFRLNKGLDEKITALMKNLELDTGSIDLLYSDQGIYYFLEVNPSGQFGMVSYPCNYYLEEEIAKKILSL